MSTKKHKTWDGDGILHLHGGYANLKDVSGRQLGKVSWNDALSLGDEVSFGSKEVQIESVMPREELLSGRNFLGSVRPDSLSKPQLSVGPKPLQVSKHDIPNRNPQPPIHKTSRPVSKATSTQFKNPLLSSTVLPKTNSTVPQPRHDPDQPNALVMKRLTSVPRGKRTVDVVVDPILSRHLREHQRVGVQFLYECVMGIRPFDGEGAILADEMGLGKTLQTIALLWTLMKQSPIHEEPPVVKKALIVCPATLIGNWRKEFRKWLGNERIGVFVADNNKIRLTDFTMGKSYNVMIISYEKLRIVQEDLKKGVGIDIIIADEGHRLKTAQNKAAQAIKSLNTQRRVILSGTPIQNDLGEFYVMVDFVNPGLLGKYSTFRREFENPIIRSRQPGASPKDIEKGEARTEELGAVTSMFIIRRTAEILTKYLPTKTEYILFCKPTSAQASVYKAILSSPLFGNALGNSDVTLHLINFLKKVCNSPSLLQSKIVEEAQNQTIAGLLSDIPQSLLQFPGASGKLQVLDSLLHHLYLTGSEKVVLVSNYTSTLDILGNLLNSLSYSFLRLDGSVPTAKRQALVDRFNRSSSRSCFAFLLSAKAGGMGLNLIGASRLILFDVDWNPATDAQAMARIHRDGQTKPCKVYRLLMLGALDEKIFQRQVAKVGLANSVLDNKAGISSYTRDELRDLFSFDESGKCMTHELLGCGCQARGLPPTVADAATEAFDYGNDAADDGAAADIKGKQSDDSRSDDGLPELPVLLRASQVDMVAQERRIREGGNAKSIAVSKQKMQALTHYRHLDVQHFREIAEKTKNREITDDVEDLGQEEEGEGEGGVRISQAPESLVEDEILRNLLMENGNRVSFLFTKSSG